MLLSDDVTYLLMLYSVISKHLLLALRVLCFFCARFHGIVNGESLRNVFCCLLCIFYYQTTPILKILGQFEKLVFVIISVRGIYALLLELHPG